MTDVPDTLEVGRAQHHALVTLHSLGDGLGGVDPGALPGFVPTPAPVALRTVAEASHDDVPVSARVGVLYSLAKADFPQYEGNEDAYRALAASVADHRDGVDAERLLSDLKAAAQGDTPFEQTASGQALPHHEAAFVDTDVCTTFSVTVGNLRGTWVFSEFETDAPFDHVAEWVDPRNWPKRGPMMFKGMDIVGGGAPVPIDALGSEHWHGVFREQVQLVRRLDTLLHCDFWRDGDQACGMTYDLSLSLDRQIDVDRGFLLVVDQGATRRVRVLKIVGFTDDMWDDVAGLVCPFWTDWVRGAVEGGSTSSPQTPTHQPGPTQQPSSEKPSSSERLDEWMQFFAESARVYTDMCDAIAGRVAQGGYDAGAATDDMRRYWTQIAQDWSRAWQYGMETVTEVTQQGLDAGLAPPGVERDASRGFVSGVMSTATSAMGGWLPGMASTMNAAAEAARAASTAGSAATMSATGPVQAEATVVPVPALAAGVQPRVRGFTCIEAGGASIPEAAITVVVDALDDGTPAVRVSTTDQTAMAGLYVGVVEDQSGGLITPVQLYLSRAEAPRP